MGSVVVLGVQIKAGSDRFALLHHHLPFNAQQQLKSSTPTP